MQPRRRLLAASILATLVALGPGACVGDDPVVGPQVESGAPETSTTAETGAGTDASQLPDAGATDAADANAADAKVPFCSGANAALAFCADFDNVPAVETGWQAKIVAGDAVVDFFTGDFVSPPKCALFKQGTQPGNDARMFTQALATGGKRAVTLSFKWKITAYTFNMTPQASQLLEISENGKASLVMEAGTDFGYRLRNDPGGGGASAPPTGFTNPPTGSWIDVVLNVVFVNAATGSYELRVGGAVVATRANITTSSDVATTTIGLGIGPKIIGTGTQPAIETYVDDLTVAFK
jgi:hypothetical protein